MMKRRAQSPEASAPPVDTFIGGGSGGPRRPRRDKFAWHSPKPDHDPFPFRSGSPWGTTGSRKRSRGERIDPFSFRVKAGGTDISRFIGSGRRSRRYLAKEQTEDEEYGQDQFAGVQQDYPEQEYGDGGEPYAEVAPEPEAAEPPRDRRDPYTFKKKNSDITRFVSQNENVTRFAGGSDRPRQKRDRFAWDGNWSPGEGARRAAHNLLGF